MNIPAEKTDLKEIFGNIFFLTTLFLLFATQISFFSWLIFMLPIAVFVTTGKRGSVVGTKVIAVSLVIAFLASLVFQSTTTFLLSLTTVPMGFVFAYYRKRNVSPLVAGFAGFLSLATSWLIFGLILNVIEGAFVYSAFLTAIQENIGKTMIDFYRGHQDIDEETLFMIEQGFQHLKVFLPQILPSFFAASGLMVTGFSLIAGDRLLNRLSVHGPWPGFGHWKLPEKLVWLAIAGALLILSEEMLLRTIGITLLVSMAVLFCFQGFAILLFFLNVWKVPKIARVIIYITVLLQSFGTIFLFILGIVNVWIDMRNNYMKKNMTNSQ